MRRISLSTALLIAAVTGQLSGCAHTGGGPFASRAAKIEAKYDLARLAESDGQLDKARQGYEDIYKKNSNDAEVCHRLGIVNAKQSNYDAAIRFLNEAHKLDPADAEILNDLGYACYLSNDFTTAESSFQKSLKIAPNNKRATNNLAMVYGNQGRYEESLRTFRLANGEAEANANVAYLYAQSGDGKKALEHYNRALSLKPDLKVAATGMIEIAEMQQKLDSDRAQLAQQNPPQADRSGVAQVSGRSQPNGYPELANAVGSQAAPANYKAAANPSPVATPVGGTRPALNAGASAPVPLTTAPATAAPVATPAVAAQGTPAQIATASRDDDFEDLEKVGAPAKSPVITPSRAVQSANAPKVDYIGLCPQATDAVKVLLGQMNTNDVNQLKLALHKLGELEAEGKTGAPAARAALKHPDTYIRIHAALALWRTEQNTTDSLPVFVEGLQNKDPNVRSFTATALSMGPKTDGVVAPLTAALSDSSPFVRLHSAETLYKHPGQEAVALKSLIAHLDHTDANVRWLAIFIMGEVLPKSQDAVDALTLALYDTDNRIRAGAAFALGGLGHDAKSALPELKELSNDQNPEVRQSVQDAIHEIEGQSAQASAASRK